MRTHLSFLALLGISIAAPPVVPGHKDVPRELIFGGHRAYQGSFPYFAYLHNCGGSLLTPKHVLTAAHCVDDGRLGTTIVMGLDDNEHYEGVHGVQIRKIIHVESHKDYNQEGKSRDDIAILEVDEPFQLDSNVQLANIKGDDTELRKSYWGTAIGFGLADVINGTGVWPRYLQYVYEPVLDDERCLKTWSSRFWDKQLCAGGKNIGVSHGDSGGPLAIRQDGKDFQIGITSYGAMGQYRNQDVYPSVFTRTASYCDWMTEKTNGAFLCQ